MVEGVAAIDLHGGLLERFRVLWLIEAAVEWRSRERVVEGFVVRNDEGRREWRRSRFEGWRSEDDEGVCVTASF